MNNTHYNLVTILGPTASGKTRLAALLAAKVDGEVISADSRQIYRDMNLGTGKDYNDYVVKDRMIPCHLIDIVDPGYEYNVFEYQRDFVRVFRDITARGKLPVLCGGSGLYLEAVLRGYRLIDVPENKKLRETLEEKSMNELEEMLRRYKTLHNITDTVDRKRMIRAIEIESYYHAHPEISVNYPKINALVVGIRYDRDTRRKQITERLKDRLKKGMVQEVKQLIDHGISPEKMIYYGLEYKYITLYLKGELNYNEMITSLNTAIHRFSKRQLTWFGRMERTGIKINWVDGLITDDIKLKKIINWLGNGTFSE
jgi:tRNA dimethylallyltransferase